MSEGTCLCGHRFGSEVCLSAHASRKAAMEPVEIIPHEHRWMRPIRGVLFCGVPNCDAIARLEYP